MLATAHSGAVYGVDAFAVEIEVNTGHGDPQMVIVGLPDAAVKESRDRVHTALSNCELATHLGRTTINLAPADIKKEGPSFDLPIAVGITATQDALEPEAIVDCGIVGELALSGEVRRVRGVLPIAIKMRELGLARMIVPSDNADEAAIVEGIDVYPVRTLRQAIEFLAGRLEIRPHRADMDALSHCETSVDDFADVRGQEQAKRALEVAAAGGHNLLAIGPPGTGKSMLAKRLPGILPPLSMEEALEVTKVHSISGTLAPRQALVAQRPFRAPHHTISDAGLLGGGTQPMPGEVSLAHRGVLFLDELPEFRRNVLEVLRQPLEDGSVTISRAAATVTFPSDFMLIAAMNPCPCGFYGDHRRECRCTPTQIQKYRNKISGPLLDRIDIHVEVPAIEYEELVTLESGEASSPIRERAETARRLQYHRFRDDPGVHCNAQMDARLGRRHCPLDSMSSDFLRAAMKELDLSARAYDRILRVARTIADLSDSDEIRAEHVGEAIQYRSLDRQLWA